MEKFYITTAIPYVNSKPHIGHALEFVQADVIARYNRLLGKDVCLLSGGDENALKNVQAAEKAGKPIRSFIDENAELFRKMAQVMKVKFDIFQKGSDEKTHFPSSQKLWTQCYAAGDIYRKTYAGLYCVGCEAFYTMSELNSEGECHEHPGKKLDTVSEENYFFRLSKYQSKLVKLINSNTLRIIPEFRKNEILSFLKQPLKDISISRSNERAKNWGVPVPDDSSQRIYVWFDALNIYQSGVGFGWNDRLYSKWWPADVHVIGKGISRFHAVYWPAFLLSANLGLPKTIFIHEYFTVNGQKMSKTLGNVIDPVELAEKYGAEALRYYLLAKFSPFTDGDFSETEFIKTYNADLANGLGNLISRVAVMSKDISVLPEIGKKTDISMLKKYFIGYEFDKAISHIWDMIRECDRYINDNQVWAMRDKTKSAAITHLVTEIRKIAQLITPFLPETALLILRQYNGSNIVPDKPLFPRIT